MKDRKTFFLFALFLVGFVALMVDPALAGPGGKIAKAVYETFWGKVVLFILVILLLPLIIYVLAKEKIAERRARRDLKYMAQFHPNFEWFKIRERVIDCFLRVHGAWREEDMAEASEFMTGWYWQNQQLVFLNRWMREGLINHCNVKKIKSLKPLLFLHRNDDAEHEGSVLVVSVEANMKDYLAERDTGKVVEGSKRFKEVETVWSFTLIDGKWRVSNIEEGEISLEYAQEVASLPAIEETVIEKSRA